MLYTVLTRFCIVGCLPYKDQLLIVNKQFFYGLRTLLQAGGIDFVDSSNSTLIHFAIDLDKPAILDLLLDTEAAPIDVEGEQTENYGRETPLLFALRMQKVTLARRLVHKGADLNLVDRNGFSALFWALGGQQDLQLAKLLLDKGADVNWKGAGDDSLLNYVARRPDGVHMLLFYGIEVPKPEKGKVTAFDVASPEVREVLVDYIFHGERYDLRLKTVVRMGSSLLQRLADYVSDVWYLDDEYEELLCYEVAEMDTFCLNFLMERFDHAVEYILREYCLLVTFASTNKQAVDNFSALVNSRWSTLMIDNINRYRDSPLRFEWSLGEFVERLASMPDQTHTERLLYLLAQLVSQGAYFDQTDVGVVYVHHGFCPLFKSMIADTNLLVRGRNRRKVLMAKMIYDVRMTLDDLFEQAMDGSEYLHLALELFCDRRLKKFCLKYYDGRHEEQVESMPEVPLLVELARNSARKRLVDFYQVESFAELCRVLEKLSVPREIFEILTFERKLYRRICS